MVSKLIIFHLPAYVYYLYAFVYDLVNIEEGSSGFGGKFKFLTVWNVALYFGLATANDCCGTHFRPSDQQTAHKSSLQKWRDSFFSCIAFPVGMFVVIAFWGLYAVDRELIFPKRLDDIIPPWLNHALHTVVAPVLLLEVFMVYHQFPTKRRGIITLAGFSLLYLSWILWIAYYDNYWVYPVLRVLQMHQRVAFIGSLLLVFVVIYLICDVTNKVFWGRERQVATKMNQKKLK